MRRWRRMTLPYANSLMTLMQGTGTGNREGGTRGESRGWRRSRHMGVHPHPPPHYHPRHPHYHPRHPHYHHPRRRRRRCCKDRVYRSISSRRHVKSMTLTTTKTTKNLINALPACQKRNSIHLDTKRKKMMRLSLRKQAVMAMKLCLLQQTNRFWIAMRILIDPLFEITEELGTHYHHRTTYHIRTTYHLHFISYHLHFISYHLHFISYHLHFISYHLHFISYHLHFISYHLHFISYHRLNQTYVLSNRSFPNPTIKALTTT